MGGYIGVLFIDFRDYSQTLGSTAGIVCRLRARGYTENLNPVNPKP